MQKYFILLLLTSFFACTSENYEAVKFNFGFEHKSETEDLSEGWFKWGNYELSIDSSGHSGQMAGKITADINGRSFGSIAYKIPAKYKGKTIKLSGYMKIKEVKEGFAGLVLRIDGEGGSLAFDNMEKRKISGTRDWQKYSITLDYPTNAKNINIGGILSGKGEAWFDDFILTIDGKDVQTLKEVERVISKAELDKTFDDGSNIIMPKLTTSKINNLALLGRVWGFIKYHHPEIAKGNYNWDYELFRFLPKYLKSTNESDRDNLIIQWIDSLGEVDQCVICKSVNEDAFLKPNFEWINKQDNALKNKLLSIFNNRSQGEHHYINMAPNVGNPIFRNENPYNNMPYPDDAFRLLALYKYWNMINYYFPYKHLMDKDWNLTLKEYIPAFLSAKDEFEYEIAALKIIGEINDTHANLWGGGDKISEWKGEYYPPIHVRFIENKLVVADYYNPEMKNDIGLEIGDVITKINGQNIEDIIKEKRQFYPASNSATQLRNMSRDLLRSISPEIEIEYFTDNLKTEKKTLQLFPKGVLDIYYNYRKNEDKSYRMLDNNIGYITLGSINKKDIPIIKDEFKNAKGIIIDIRNYPSTFVPFSLGSYFISNDAPFVKFTRASKDTPGEFNYSDDLIITKDKNTYQGKLIVIVNEISQSQAEYTAMAFRAGDNTTIIGSTTAGADGNISKIILPGGLRTIISGIGVYYPNGDETQRLGIIPDIEVKPTIEGIRKNKDELINKAIELILK